ncbi:MAG: TonB-dependent receptor [Proteobacteria bacterium]|nr:TonB-dependent receptor [Desulfobacula sp.]MBU4130713.1 TonB-dependent receptor [Pseudomonadota bacterium]
MPLHRVSPKEILKNVIPKLMLFFFFLTFLSPVPGSAAPGEEAIALDQELDYLQQEAQAFDMMITAGKRPERIADVPASVLVVTRQDIETHGYMSLDEILANIPGLYTFGFYSIGDKVSGIRGLGIENLVILVNGVNQVGDVGSDFISARTPVPVEAIDRIEVVRGPLSVMYGAGAFLGVINIITNEVSSVRKNNMVSVSYGSAETQKAFLRTAGEKYGWTSVLNGSVYKTDGIDQALVDLVNDPADLQTLGIPLDERTSGRLEERQSFINFSTQNSHLFFDFSYAETRKEGYFLVPSLNEGTNGLFQSLHASAGYRANPMKEMWFEGRFTYSHGVQKNHYQLLDETNNDHQELGSDAWEAEINLFYTPTPQMDFSTGIYYRSIYDAYTQYDIPSLGAFDTRDWLASDESIDTAAVFGQARYSPLDDLKLIAGVRFEQMKPYRLRGERSRGTPYYESVTGVYDKDDIESIPRLAAIYNFNPRHVLKLIYTTAIRRPSFWDNTKATLNANTLGNLSPEQVTAYELNYSATLSPRFKSNISLFRNEFEQMIDYYLLTDKNGNKITQMLNVEAFYTNGIEFTLTSQVLPTIKAELSGTFQRTRLEQRSDIIAPFSPEVLGYFKLSYHPNRDLSLGVTANYVGETEAGFEQITKNADGTTTYGERVAGSAPGYINMGINLRAENVWKDGLFVNLKISNPFDWDIRTPGSDTWSSKGTLGFGRQFLFSLGYQF